MKSRDAWRVHHEAFDEARARGASFHEATKAGFAATDRAQPEEKTTVTKQGSLLSRIVMAIVGTLLCCLHPCGPARAENCPQYRKEIQEAARAHMQHPRLLDGLVWSESRCQPEVIGKAGEVGLGQLSKWASGGLTRKQLLDPATNLRATARWMAAMQVACGEGLWLWLPAYNTGKCGVGKRYARKVLRSAG